MELLVVIGIIAVLIALLLPSLSRARYQSMLAKCASNQRQYALAMQVYANENDGALPRFDGPTGAGNLHDLVAPGWYDLFHGRYKFPDEFFFCPLQTQHQDELTVAGFVISGYAIWVPRLQQPNNPASQIPPDPPPATSMYQLAGPDVIRGPSRLGDALADKNPVISDDIFLYPNAVANPAGFSVKDAPPSAFYQDRMGHTINGRLDSSNAGYLDGHVETLSPPQIQLRYLSGNAWNCR